MISQKNITIISLAAILAATLIAYGADPALAQLNKSKEFYLFSTEIPGVEEVAKLPGDGFSTSTLVVNQNDNVTVHFYNVDPNIDEIHSFTIDAYSVDVDVKGGDSSTFSFVANQTGVFQFYCKYHLPVMVGQLVVLP